MNNKQRCCHCSLLHKCRFFSGFREVGAMALSLVSVARPQAMTDTTWQPAMEETRPPAMAETTRPTAMAESSQSDSEVMGDAALLTCNPQVAPFKRRPAAKRKYDTADALASVQIQEHLCIKGCRLKQFVALPITTMGGKRYTRIASKESWMCELLAGRVCTSEMQHGVSMLKEFVIRELSCGQSPARAASTELSTLVIALDSEDEEPAAQPEPPAVQPERRRRQMGTMTGVINLHGVTVAVMVQHRTLWVEADAGAVAAMLTQLQRCLVPSSVRSARRRAALGRQPVSPESTSSGSSSCAADPGATLADSQTTAEPKVYLGNGRYYVSYVNDHGQRTTCSKGLAVRQRDTSGKPLSAAAYEAELERVRQLAIQMWRDLDKGITSRAASQM